MDTEPFPTKLYCSQLVRFLDALDYDDSNLTRNERLEGLRFVHSRTAAYFAQPIPQEILKDIQPKRIAAVIRTNSQLLVCGWSKVPQDIQVDVCIYFSIINILDDVINTDPSTQMISFWTDLLQGKQQKHPFWVLINAHLPNLLRHFGTFCAFNIMRGTFDYFEGCWIEQYNFRGYPGADCYPWHVRRLNALGGSVGGTIFPAVRFDDQKCFKEFSCVMAHMDGPVALINDLFSYYKEFNLNEANLVTNWCMVDGITQEQALLKLTDDAIHACVQVLSVLKDKDPKVLDTVRGFIHGYITWHICELRYRLHEIYDSERNDDGLEGVKFRQYFEKARSVGFFELEEWTSPQKDVQQTFTQAVRSQAVRSQEVRSQEARSHEARSLEACSQEIFPMEDLSQEVLPRQLFAAEGLRTY